MRDFAVLEPSADPNNRITFLLDWEITMKCNLDCSYCETGINGGHDNSTQHPTLDSCYQTIDFMFEYVDLYMSHRPKGLRTVILNVYGGESLHHPEILAILLRCREVHARSFADKWGLTITTTTNAIITLKKMQQVIPLIDEFTCSYHAENTPKQKKLFQDNLIMIRNAERRLKVVVLMHADANLFEDTKAMIEWCESNDIRYLPRQLDHRPSEKRFHYGSQQITWFEDFYKGKGHRSDLELDPVVAGDKFDIASTGRACCGGRQVCLDQNYRQREYFIKNQFPDWFCSVNYFFLFIKQITGDIYVNKDCQMDFSGSVGPIGHLSRATDLIAWTRSGLDLGSMPVIQCKKNKCMCGLCAPKARNRTDYDTIMEKYIT